MRGDGPDELIAWYEGSGTTSRRFTSLDERNSVISATDGSGTLVGINKYDEYGMPQSGNVGRMQYTGQMWLPEANAAYYKARSFLPHLGVFAQTDPIGPQDDANLYAYTANDPVNFMDPLGMNYTFNTPWGTWNCDWEGQGGTQWTCTFSANIYVIGSGSNNPSCDAILCYRITNPSGPGRTREPQPGTAPGLGATPTTPPIASAAAPTRLDFCGSAGHNVPDGNWAEACAVHDKCYATSGAVKEACDIQLTVNIAAVCSAKTLQPNICAIPGIIYGAGLIFFGITPFYHPARDAFNNAQRRH